MNNPSQHSSRIAVAQLGARRHYAVPLAFEREGLLEHFYTDAFLKGAFLPQLIGGISRVVPLQSIRRLAGRHCSGLPPHKITSFWRLGNRGKMHPAGSDMIFEWLRTGESFCRSIVAEGLGLADAVYTFSSAAKELLIQCREKALHGILDHATAPQKAEMKLVRDEQRRFPGWSGAVAESAAMEAYCQRQHDEADLASVIICGCTFVKEMLMGEGINGNKIRVVPLGVSLPSEPVHLPHEGLHVLFAGGDGLRKGIGYLARAAELLAAKSISVRAIGDMGLSADGLSAISPYVEILGPVPRSGMQDQLAWADVVVLPSVSETFGLVILEAMAVGVAVVTTTSTCGPDVIRDGVDGFVIPPRDAEAIAAKLDWMASNPAQLQDMQRAARMRAAEFSLDQYGRRLAEAVGENINA